MRNMSHSVLCEQAMIKLSLSNSVVTEAGGEKSYGIPELLNHQCDDVAIDGPEDLTGHLKLAFATEADRPQPEWSVSGGSLSYGFDVVEVYLKSDASAVLAHAPLHAPCSVIRLFGRGLPLRASGRPLPLLDCHDRQHDPQFPSFAQVHSA
jgi:hypothetical protein